MSRPLADQVESIYNENMRGIFQRFLQMLVFFAFCVSTEVVVTCAEQCSPTKPDMLGPFYKPDAPVRPSVGKGYILSGAVRSAQNCAPLPGAMVEFWLAGPEGDYADSYRATVFSDKKGEYRFESHFPPPYYGRPSHIHIRVSAAGFKALVTQHYPEKGDTRALFDLVLEHEQ